MSYFIMGFLSFALCIVFQYYIWKRLQQGLMGLAELAHKQAVVQNMALYDMAEYILLDLAEKQKQRALTDEEIKIFHRQRDIIRESEEKLKLAGYVKKSSF